MSYSTRSVAPLFAPEQRLMCIAPEAYGMILHHFHVYFLVAQFPAFVAGEKNAISMLAYCWVKNLTGRMLNICTPQGEPSCAMAAIVSYLVPWVENIP